MSLDFVEQIMNELPISHEPRHLVQRRQSRELLKLPSGLLRLKNQGRVPQEPLLGRTQGHKS